jgi:hypothetical protein
MPEEINDSSELSVVCDNCGKQLTVCNEYGMFCENLCELEDSKKAANQLDSLIKGLINFQDI